MLTKNYQNLKLNKMLGLEDKSFPSFKLHNPKTVKEYVCVSDFFEAVSIFRISTHQNCLNISEVVLFFVYKTANFYQPGYSPIRLRISFRFMTSPRSQLLQNPENLLGVAFHVQTLNSFFVGFWGGEWTFVWSV